MIALGIRYLTRRCVAVNANKTEVEWPPHPGRVFMALAAAHFESPDPAPAEREALRWLERQIPPAISETAPEGQRSGVEGYVPANDATGGIVSRPRSARRFTSKYVGDTPVLLRWDAEPSPEVRRALEGLCARVTRIGHSSSLVQLWLAGPASEAPNWRPVAFAPNARNLRVASGGTLSRLVRSFAQQERPRLNGWQPYSSNQSEGLPAIPGPFSPEILVFSCDKERSTRLGLASTLQLTSALRNAAMNLSVQPPPEWLSGHAPSGDPSALPHCAFFPLPFVGGEHGDGHLLGVALAIPAGLSDERLRPALGALLFDDAGSDRELSLWCKAWRWVVRRETSSLPPLNLRAATWTGPSRSWASVTPVVLHHHPKPNRPGDVERIVREAFLSAGYPEPERLTVQPASIFRGAGHARELPAYDEGGARMCRYQIHVVAHFAGCVAGPMLVGRGRFRGYGLLRPIAAERAS